MGTILAGATGVLLVILAAIARAVAGRRRERADREWAEHAACVQRWLNTQIGDKEYRRK